MSKRIVLISCCKTKLPGTHKAQELYCSPLFKISLKSANTFNPDGIFILSAKHHLLDLNKEISYYDCTLKNMKADDRRRWAGTVLAELGGKFNLKEDDFIFLTGQNYYKDLIGPGRIENYQLYYKENNLTGIGKIIQHLKTL